MWTAETYRDWLRENGRPDLAEKPDYDLDYALAKARKWVGWKKYSDAVVALNVLKDGYPHA